MNLITLGNADNIALQITNDAVLGSEELKNNGLTELIIRIAIQRFANIELFDIGVRMANYLFIKDFQTGFNPVTGERLPLFALKEGDWQVVSYALEQALRRSSHTINLF